MKVTSVARCLLLPVLTVGLPSCVQSYSAGRTIAQQNDVQARINAIWEQHKQRFAWACRTMNQLTLSMDAETDRLRGQADPNQPPVGRPTLEECQTAHAVFECFKELGLLESDKYPKGRFQDYYWANMRAMAIAQRNGAQPIYVAGVLTYPIGPSNVYVSPEYAHSNSPGNPIIRDIQGRRQQDGIDSLRSQLRSQQREMDYYVDRQRKLEWHLQQQQERDWRRGITE